MNNRPKAFFKGQRKRPPHGPGPRGRPNDKPFEKKRVADFIAEKKAKSLQLENWIWGEHSIEACALHSPERLLEIFVEKSVQNKIPKLLGALAGLNVSFVERLPRFLAEKRTQGLAAKITGFPVYHENDFFSSEVRPQQVLLLDRIQDPQNFGAILRSAAALGGPAVFIGHRDQCPVNGTVAMVSAGNLFRVSVYSGNNLARSSERLEEEGYTVLALETGGKDLSSVLQLRQPKRIAWILGSEEQGIQKMLVKSAAEVVGIPMVYGTESLNVSNSAAIALYVGYSSNPPRKDP